MKSILKRNLFNIFYIAFKYSEIHSPTITGDDDTLKYFDRGSMDDKVVKNICHTMNDEMPDEFSLNWHMSCSYGMVHQTGR